MAKSVNKVIILGRLGKDPELKYTANGKAFARFSVATESGYNENAKTEWHNIVAWEKLAEIVNQYLRKGAQVYLEGRIQTREWDKDGVKQRMTEIVADQVVFCGGGKRDDSGSDSSSASRSYSNPVSDDDIPF